MCGSANFTASIRVDAGPASTSVITAAPVPRALPTTKQAKDYVAATLTPTLTAGLVALCRAKPAEPAAFLAQYLIEHNPAGGKAKA